MKFHNFHHNQRVSFIGGEGIIRNFKLEGESWKYLIEMELGIMPNFGRIGAETMILLDEIELEPVEK